MESKEMLYGDDKAHVNFHSAWDIFLILLFKNATL